MVPMLLAGFVIYLKIFLTNHESLHRQAVLYSMFWDTHDRQGHMQLYLFSKPVQIAMHQNDSLDTARKYLLVSKRLANQCWIKITINQPYICRARCSGLYTIIFLVASKIGTVNSAQALKKVNPQIVAKTPPGATTRLNIILMKGSIETYIYVSLVINVLFIDHWHSSNTNWLKFETYERSMFYMVD